MGRLVRDMSKSYELWEIDLINRPENEVERQRLLDQSIRCNDAAEWAMLIHAVSGLGPEILAEIGEHHNVSFRDVRDVLAYQLTQRVDLDSLIREIRHVSITGFGSDRRFTLPDGTLSTAPPTPAQMRRQSHLSATLCLPESGRSYMQSLMTVTEEFIEEAQALGRAYGRQSGKSHMQTMLTEALIEEAFSEEAQASGRVRSRPEMPASISVAFQPVEPITYFEAHYKRVDDEDKEPARGWGDWLEL